jgi:hypothetical protein
MPAAVADAEPLDDIPVQYSGFQGFLGGEMDGWWSE